jgi:hypothetical protein
MNELLLIVSIAGAGCACRRGVESVVESTR